MLTPGDRFPEFDLEAHDGRRIRGGDLAGRPCLVYFYPKADTPGCAREACELRDAWDELADAGLEVYGVSYDRPVANRRFAEKHRLPFPLLSDVGRELAAAVGASRLLLPVPKRVSYLVGADGRVLAAYPSVRPATHARDVLSDFRRLGE